MNLQDEVRRAVEAFARLPPEEQARQRRLQRESWIRGEAGMGSDRDEAEYAEALRSGDTEKLAECKRKSQERVAHAQRMIDEGRV